MKITQKRKKNQKLLKSMLLMMFFLCATVVMAQTYTVKGVVTDKKKEPLIGVSVAVKGTATGTSTNLNGEFTLNVPANSKVVFTYIGYNTQEVTVTSEAPLNIVLQESEELLDEVVVVGYGVQKKVNLTGSVSNISGKELDSRPLINVSSGLGGLAPGMSVRQSTGEPGNDGAEIRIRGTGTLNAGAGPLVLIDGMEGDMNAINPQDIESISILKDAASASIYGSRAANGVILITTKKGQTGKPRITFDATLSIARPSKIPKFVNDYATYMNYVNEGAENIGVAKPFGQEDIDKWVAAKADPNGLAASGYPNYVAYSNTDWFDEIFDTNVIQTYNVGVTGGTDNFKYNMSLRYMNNPGVMMKSGTESYQGRINLESKLNKYITVGTQTWFSTQDRGPANIKDRGIFNWIRQTTPGVYPKYDGKYGYKVATGESPTANNIIANLESARGKNQTNRFSTTWFAQIDIMKGLSFETKINYTRNFTDRNSYSVSYERYDLSTGVLSSGASGPDAASSTYYYSKNHRITADNVLRYNVTLNKDHDLSLLVGHNEYYYKYKEFSAKGKGLLDFDIPTLGTTTSPEEVKGLERDLGMRSFFGRINYAYKSRYLFEANIRRDGSSRFADGNRWGTFPSASFAWRLSEEEFMGETFRDLFQNFKLRTSYGKLGNSEINSSKYYLQMNSYTNSDLYYSFNGSEISGLWMKQLGNPALKWEETNVFDIALETSLLNSRLNLEVDYYDRKTKGILYTPTIPGVMGNKDAAIMNLAEVTNSGVEITVGWQDAIRDFRYGISTNVTYNKNNVSKYQGKLKEGWTTNENGDRVWSSNYGKVANGTNEATLEGHMIGEFRGLLVYKGNGSYYNSDGSVNVNGGPRDGMIRTEKDMEWIKAMQDAGYKFQPQNSIGKNALYYGDMIYADVNGDGIYGDDTRDRVLMGASKDPKWFLGINLNAAYKGFDFSMLWQGSFKAKAYGVERGYNSNVVQTGWQIAKDVAKDHYFYDPENPNDPRTNINGKYPRLKLDTDVINNSPRSDLWLHSVSYMKLKNVQIGYTLPRNLLNQMKLSNVRVFVSGENLLTITPFKGMDPESQSFTVYPPMRQFAFGINVGF